MTSKSESKGTPLDVEGAYGLIAGLLIHEHWEVDYQPMPDGIRWSKVRAILERLYASGVKEGEERVLADPHLFHLRNDRP